MGERSFFISSCILVGPGQGAVWKLPHPEVDESYPGEYWMLEDPCKDELAWTLSRRFQHVFAVNSRAGVNLVSGRVKVALLRIVFAVVKVSFSVERRVS